MCITLRRRRRGGGGGGGEGEKEKIYGRKKQNSKHTLKSHHLMTTSGVREGGEGGEGYGVSKKRTIAFERRAVAAVSERFPTFAIPLFSSRANLENCGAKVVGGLPARRHAIWKRLGAKGHRYSRRRCRLSHHRNNF